MNPTPGTAHQRVVGKLYVLLESHVRRLGLGTLLLAPATCG